MIRLFIDSKSPHAGKTIRLGGFSFVKGSLSLHGTQRQHMGVIRYLSRSYQVKCEGDKDDVFASATLTHLEIGAKSPHAGKTVRLAGYKFVDGRMTLPGSPIANDGVVKYLNRCYQVEQRLEGMDNGKRDDHSVITGEVPGHVRPSGEESAEATPGDGEGSGDAEAGDGSELPTEGDGDSLSDEQRELRGILSDLDPANEDHWTKKGGPSAGAIKEKLGIAIPYNEIKEAWPEFNRDLARELAASK